MRSLPLRTCWQSSRTSEAMRWSIDLHFLLNLITYIAMSCTFYPTVFVFFWQSTALFVVVQAHSSRLFVCCDSFQYNTFQLIYSTWSPQFEYVIWMITAPCVCVTNLFTHSLTERLLLLFVFVTRRPVSFCSAFVIPHKGQIGLFGMYVFIQEICLSQLDCDAQGWDRWWIQNHTCMKVIFSFKCRHICLYELAEHTFGFVV